MSLREGTILDDTWVIEQPLGAGGMGSVYRAHNRHAARIKAAIKMLAVDLLSHDEANARFVREAEILFGLDHPHIVKVRNVRLEHRPPYIEMEFIEGVSLYKLLGDAPLPCDRALLFTEQLASAVRYLHRHKVYHRDIKPSNLLVRKGTVLKLVDFGLAVDTAGSERITSQNAHFGTVAYAPPEWIRPREVDPRLWDLYAIGVILYEMLTGDEPFVSDAGATAKQAAIQVMAEKQAMDHMDPGPAFPDSLRALVRELTAREPEDRIQDARDIIVRLQRIQAEMSFNANTVLATGLQGDELQKAVHERYLEIHRPPTLQEGAEPVPPHAPLPEVVPPVGPRLEPGPSTTKRVVQLATAGLVGFVLTALVCLVTAAAILGWRAWSAPTLRPVTLVATGVPRDADVAMQIGDQAVSRVDGLQHHFEAMPVGDHVIRWSAGAGCDEAPCPGEGCPDTCMRGDVVLSLGAGRGPASRPVELQLPGRRPLRVPVVDAPDGATVRVAGDEALVEGGAATVAVLPGDHDVEVAAGDCVPEARGCADDEGGCPPGCSSRVVSVHVPATGELQLPAVELPEPARAVPAPRPAPARSATGPVTRGAFASWLASHPEWSRERAIAEGRADGSYLSGVDLAAGGGRAVVSVPWAAAQAFCSGRGGLSPVAAEPHTWSEGATGLFQEWRVDDGSPAWRRYDGASSGQLSQREANAFTGFRCRR